MTRKHYERVIGVLYGFNCVQHIPRIRLFQHHNFFIVPETTHGRTQKFTVSLQILKYTGRRISSEYRNGL